MKATTLSRLGASAACPGCGLLLPECNGPTHAYLGASPACLELYGSYTAGRDTREKGSRQWRLVADAYAAQHPGAPDRRALQSVAVHLMGLCMLLEREGDSRRLEPVAGQLPVRRTLDLHWLTPPQLSGRRTIADVVPSGPDHAPSVEAWAADVWRAWTPHHDTVRSWLDRSGQAP